MKRGGKSILIIGLFSILLALVIIPFILSSSAEFSTVCYNEKHSIINHEITCEIQNNLQNSLNHELGINLNLQKNEVRNVEIYEIVEKSKQIPIYETICNPYEEDANKTTVTNQNCTQIQKGTKIVYYEELEKLTINNAEKDKWSAGQLEFKPKEKRELLIKWETLIEKTGDGWGSRGTWKVNPEGWWNISWSRKKDITFVGDVKGNWSQYLLVDKEAAMNETYQDLRFLNSSETGELGYWIKDYNSTAAEIYIFIHDNSTIYMYYGNPEVTTTSKMRNAFLCGDDFDDGDIVNLVSIGGYILNVGGGELNATYGGVHNTGAWYCSNTVNYQNYTIYHRGKTTQNGYGMFFRYDNITGNGSVMDMNTATDKIHRYHYHPFPDTVDQRGNTLYTSNANQYYNFTMNVSGINWTLYIDGSEAGSWHNNIDDMFTTSRTGIYTSMDGTNHATTDYYYVIPMININPIATFGEEESYDSIPPVISIPTITPTEPKTADNLQCYATLSDNKQVNLTAYWKWYKNGVLNLLGTTTNIENGTYSLITTLEPGNTSKSEQWKCEVLPFDGYNNGTAKNSSAVTILNTPSNQSQPLLTTPTGKNLSTENLTCENKSTYDADGDTVTNIFNWYKNSQPFLSLNLPFEINANDYSGYGNNGTIYGASFTNGTIGKALQFDGADDYVMVGDSNSLDITSDLTLEAWIYPKDVSGSHTFIVKGGENWVYVNYLLRTSGDEIEFKWYNSEFETHKTTNVNLAINNWYHVIAVHDTVNNIAKIYVNGEEKLSESTIKTKLANIRPLSIGTDRDSNGNPFLLFNGSIDEVKIYPYALSQEQIKQRYEETKEGITSSSKIVSQETTAGDNWMCQVTPNDGEDDGLTLNSSVAEIKWAITFDVRDSYSNTSLNGVSISCNYSGFNQAPYTTNPYGPYGFPPGNWGCNFSITDYFSKTITFTANNDATIDVKLSREKALTPEEHTWLEAIYNCIILKNCDLYNLLLEINQTVGNIWEHTKPTDESVITNENITNKVVNSTSNLTIDYTVNTPIKAGYSLGTYLPVRIGFWFLDVNNISCYNQGDKPTGVKDPYCQPLIIETIGPMGGQVNFTVELQPSLPAGEYSIKRIIDIDPNNVWINYGQEVISSFVMAETLSTHGISVENTGKSVTTDEEEIDSNSGSSDTASGEQKSTNTGSGITGAIIGAGQQLLSGWQLVAIIAIIGGVLIVFIISKTILRLKEGVIKKK